PRVSVEKDRADEGIRAPLNGLNSHPKTRIAAWQASTDKPLLDPETDQVVRFHAPVLGHSSR
ncbi:MAG: hypothetical protein NTW03_04245, partial [Verrucomicrobia bacterium]|nr:hypothetical protein [Verrucomicrobiota bacterium]